MRLKSELYKKEQDDIAQKIINILDLDIDNSITLYELDNDEERKNSLLQLIPIIRKYFTYNKITGVIDPKLVKRPHLSIIKGCLKHKYNINTFEKQIRIKGKPIRTTRYVITKIE